ncbi:iron chaperone [Pricia sp.]|uniref:iron chaperone n=1 Tax=Pricia sp. TaxID=2268138 RepID=UPI003593D851
MNHPSKNSDSYIAGFPEDVQTILEQVRTTIKKAAPESEETISYGMPAFKLDGKPLVYFAGYKNHIGFYATPTGHKQFEEELSHYKQGKGSVQFPLDKPMPLGLIHKIVKFRVRENLKKQSK